jgi:hypothetical protein
MLKQIINDKVLLLNSSALTISFMNVEMVLKLILLTISILYTGLRIYKEIFKQKDNNG